MAASCSNRKCAKQPLEPPFHRNNLRNSPAIPFLGSLKKFFRLTPQTGTLPVRLREVLSRIADHPLSPSNGDESHSSAMTIWETEATPPI
jgi:hypothetical protein